ncbi:MAG: hypothetical protein LUQ25_07645 [Methanoregulaceae archaeon]|nr:hypothetical protein [Methanoregulaceae archaeon]
MKTVIRCLCALILLAFCIQAVSASFSVGNVVLESRGKSIGTNDRLSPGSPVTASASMDFTSSSGETFPNEDTLLLATDLENPVWGYTRILDGNSDPTATAKGKNVNINGWMLSFPARQDLSMRVTLNGTVPASSGEIIAIRIAELDRKNNVVSGSEVIRKISSVNPEEISGVISSARDALSSFRAAIDENIASGVDTTDAEGKYSEASTEIQNAESSVTASKFTDAQGYASNAKTLITQGTAMLDKSSAEKLVVDAQNSLDTTDEMITYFKVNRSMGSDARLAPLLESADSASGLISEAKESIEIGDYSTAREKATQALNKAKSTFDDAIAFRASIGEGSPLDGLFGIFKSSEGSAPVAPATPSEAAPSSPGLGGILIYIIGIVAVIAVVGIGIVLYRRRSGWDELG